MANEFKSLLPPNSLPSESALEQASAEIIAAVPLFIRASKSPENCPEHLLPWLAWEFGVDAWNTDWTIQEKRNVISRAAYVHRHRGTKAAIIRSLEDSPFGSNIVEWFERSPLGEPYSFELDVIQDGRPVNQQDVQDLKNAVLRGKNLRSWFSISFSGELSGEAVLAGYMVASEFVEFIPSPEAFLVEDGATFVSEVGERLLTETRFDIGQTI
jgi:phage tail P2-like protein